MLFMAENWCYNAKVLKEISKHHESGEPMPDELINKIIDSQFINQGLFNLRQLYFGKFDLTVHGQTSESARELHWLAAYLTAILTVYTVALDYTKLWNDLREQVCTVPVLWRLDGCYDVRTKEHSQTTGDFWRVFASGLVSIPAWWRTSIGMTVAVDLKS